MGQVTIRPKRATVRKSKNDKVSMIFTIVNFVLLSAILLKLYGVI